MGWISDAFGGSEAKKAAEAAERGYQDSIGTFRAAENTARTDYQPYSQFGKAGVSNVLAALGGDYSNFYESPDYQFRLAEGNKALDRSAAARGMLLSGAQLKDLSRFNQGLASTEYGNWFNRNMGAVNTGLGATNSMANIGVRTAENVGSAQQGVGQARASGYLAKAGIKNALANTVLNAGMAAATGGMSGFSGFGGGTAGADALNAGLPGGMGVDLGYYG